ncbi:hypothetical protein RP20_CCG024336 [Aedes albopictus]|nr:hypothetical protein RP20_CCG024336 [Aedes albopictus]
MRNARRSNPGGIKLLQIVLLLLLDWVLLAALVLLLRGVRRMNDYLQNILHNDISDLKREFPLFETADTFEAHQARQHRAHTQLWTNNVVGNSTPDEDFSEQTESSTSPSKALVAVASEAASTRTLDLIQLEPISIVPILMFHCSGNTWKALRARRTHTTCVEQTIITLAAGRQVSMMMMTATAAAFAAALTAGSHGTHSLAAGRCCPDGSGECACFVTIIDDGSDAMVGVGCAADHAAAVVWSSEKKNPQIVNVKQTFRFPNNFITKKNSFHACGSTSRRPVVPRHMYSQTSKTIVELYDAQKRENEVRQILSPHMARSVDRCSDSELSSDERSNHPVRGGGGRNTSYTVLNGDPSKKPHHKSNARPVDMVMIKPKNHRPGTATTSYFAAKKKRPTSKRKYTRSIRSRDRFSLLTMKSPKRKTRFPPSKAETMSDELSTDKAAYGDDSLNITSESSNPSNDSLDEECSTFGEFQINKIIDKLQDHMWEVTLQGIRELMDTANQIDWKKHEKHMTVINRKMIDFLKSPRSSLCRSACQAAGELFREAKSTKRPEFDEIVDILLCKTADPNRFIQKDANVALDKLVTYIPSSHSVRALSARGPIHKNPLVRTATARLLVCICALSGLDAILGTNANPRTRKAILSMLAKFLTDKNLETRKFGERMYKMLRKHKFFNEYFYKDMDSNCKNNLKRMLKGI